MTRGNASDPIRVLWLIKGLGPGGAERLLVNQATVSTDPGVVYEAAYLVPWKDHLVPDLEACGVAVECYEARHSADVRWVARLRRRLAGGDVDVLHSHSPLPASLARVAVRSLPLRLRPALVYTEHNRWQRYGRGTRWLNRLTYGLDAKQIAVSEGVRETVSTRRRSGVETLVHGIDVESVAAQGAARAAVRAELGVGDDDVVVGTVANFTPKKGYPDLLQAASLVDPELPIVFVSVGQGPLEDEIRLLHRELGLGDRFRLLGYRQDATRVMAAFDLFTLASLHEGFPVSVMEAQAQGHPVVATNVGGLPEAIEDGVTGRLVPPGRPQALADAIVALAGDRSARRDIGAAAKAASGRFDAVVPTRRLEEIYREVAFSP